MPPAVLKIKTLEEIVLGKCKSFVTMGVWPAGEKLKPHKWLDNFLDSEREHALYLLNSFTYYNMEMSMALLKGSFLSLSKYIQTGDMQRTDNLKWAEIVNESVFVPVVGESPSITDSGVILAGNLRRDLLIPEEKILTVEKLYEKAYKNTLTNTKRVIFFDDFVGSGQQFKKMWNDDFEKDTELLPCVREQCSKLNLVAHYCGMIGTSYGMDNIRNSSPDVHLSFAHTLEPNASPLHSNSMTWPEHLRASGPEFILMASRRAGVPEKELKGFYNLGLALAFSFTIPDATLPIFRWDNGNWSPLMKKS